MGIPGLLPLLAPTMRPVHVSAHAGRRAAVDAYAWLHRGAHACALALALAAAPAVAAAAGAAGAASPAPAEAVYVAFCMRRVAMLVRAGITPLLVFDGAYLPSKAATEDARRA